MGKVGGQDTQIGNDVRGIQSGSIARRSAASQNGGRPLANVFPDGIHPVDDGRADMARKNEAVNEDNRCPFLLRGRLPYR